MAVLTGPARAVSFLDQIYPVFQKAGWPNCRNENGVASATRLHFPDEDAAKPRIEAFGRSLIELGSVLVGVGGI